MEQYLARNLAIASSVGIGAAADKALERLAKMKRPPKWLVAKFEAIREREAKIRPHLVEYRGEVSPYREQA